MMQGDSYRLPMLIQKADGTVITDADVANVEICIGRMIKTTKSGEVTYSDGYFHFPLTQEETFKLAAGPVMAQVRVAWPDGSVEGDVLGVIHISKSTSKEVL